MSRGLSFHTIVIQTFTFRVSIFCSVTYSQYLIYWLWYTIVTGLGLTILVFLLYICVRPFSRKIYRRLAASIGSSSFLDGMALILPNIRICLTPDSDIFSSFGTSILVCNHALEGLDWWVMFMLGRCLNLRGSIRIFLKKNSTKGTCEYLQYPPLKFLIQLLEYPLLPSIHGKDYVQDRSGLFELLRGFAEESCDAGSMSGNNPVHFLIFPEGADYNGNMAEVARREGRPQLKHLSLPRTTGFNACLETLRPSNPVVYDVTMSYIGYDGKVNVIDRTPWNLFWQLLTHQIPEVHIKIKREDMDDVLHDSQWLDKSWLEKDRMLEHFYRHQCFPRSKSAKCRTFDTKFQGIEGSIVGLIRLMVVPFFVPLLVLISIPLMWTIGWLWFVYKSYILLFERDKTIGGVMSEKDNSRPSTPFVPATPFVSPIDQM